MENILLIKKECLKCKNILLRNFKVAFTYYLKNIYFFNNHYSKRHGTIKFNYFFQKFILEFYHFNKSL